MITAVDTNVLLDILIPSAPHGDESEQKLAAAAQAGAVVISEAVYAELAAYFDAAEDIERLLTDTGLRLQPSSPEALRRAGEAWRAYARRRPASLVCPQCGTQQAVRCEHCGASIGPRQHLITDFMIGAHALVHADCLLTRDRGYYTTYFPDLTLA